MKENEAYVKTHINSLRGKELQTLGLKKPFIIDYLSSDIILITTSSGASRNVPLEGTIDAYNHIQRRGTLTRAEIRENNYSDWNPAYIAAILASFPEIKYKTKPITLFLKPKD